MKVKKVKKTQKATVIDGEFLKKLSTLREFRKRGDQLGWRRALMTLLKYGLKRRILIDGVKTKGGDLVKQENRRAMRANSGLFLLTKDELERKLDDLRRYDYV